MSIEYSYSIPGVSPLRLVFYIELPQETCAMVNGGGVAYTLTTYVGPSNLWMLDTAQAHSVILDVTYQPSPGTLVQEVFGSTSATLNYDRFMIEIKSKILRVVQERIFKPFSMLWLTIIPTNLRLRSSMSFKSSLIRKERKLVAWCKNIILRF